MAKQTPPVVVVGARSVRQGTGPFIAAGLAAGGAQIAAIVGTSDASVAAALAGLATNQGIATRGYTCLEQALAEQQPGAVALCSPWRFHAEQLLQVAEAGCHCLVEKPLAWPADESQVEAIIDAYSDRGLLLQVVNQWPTTLPAFAAIHGPLPEAPAQFSMRLSPISLGADMITDSAPHFIGMLQALAGPGDCLDSEFSADHTGLSLSCRYRHATGALEAGLRLETCAQRPRPAWYAIDGKRVDRQVQLPAYRQFLAGAGRRVALEDPLQGVTRQFLADLGSGRATARAALLAAHRNLLQLAAAKR